VTDGFSHDSLLLLILGLWQGVHHGGEHVAEGHCLPHGGKEIKKREEGTRVPVSLQNHAPVT
jgi:hypothetical protein